MSSLEEELSLALESTMAVSAFRNKVTDFVILKANLDEFSVEIMRASTNKKVAVHYQPQF